MFLSILVPHFNEQEHEIKPLLDSIAFQQNFDLSNVEVIICDDGPDAVHLSDDFLSSYHLNIQYHREPKGGVSKMRNTAFDYSSGEYVAFCDADDCYYHALAFWLIKRETTTPMDVTINNVQTKVTGYDVLRSCILEEGKNPQTGETYFIDRKECLQFVHGAVYNAKFLRDNNIRFFDDCYIHEDNVLYGQAASCTNKIKWCQSPFYLWKWRDSSVCRRDPLYLKKTYVDMIKSSDHLIDWFKMKSKHDNARQTTVQIVYDAYYTFCHPSWKTIETQEYRDNTEKKFSEFFKKHEELWNESPDQLKMAISNGIRQRVVSEGMEMETETLNDFLRRMKALS